MNHANAHEFFRGHEHDELHQAFRSGDFVVTSICIGRVRFLEADFVALGKTLLTCPPPPQFV